MLLAEHYGSDPRRVHAYIVGEHGDCEVPVWSLANIAGMRLARLGATNGVSATTPPLGEIFIETRDAAYQIIERKGATYYAVAAGLVRIVEAILRDQRTVLSVSSLVDDGSYGPGDVCLSLPTVVGRNGVEQVLRLDLSPSEQDGLRRSADVLRATIRLLEPDAQPTHRGVGRTSALAHGQVSHSRGDICHATTSAAFRTLGPGPSWY